MMKKNISANEEVLWENLSWPEIPGILQKVNGFVMLPIGATEQHGPHLPLGVDSMTALDIACAVSSRTGIPVLPELKYGCSYGHSAKWPGTISFSPNTLISAVGDIILWLRFSGLNRLVIINGHVGNSAPLKCALENLRLSDAEFRVRILSLWDISPEINDFYHADAQDFHANCAETSLMLSLHPERVKMMNATDEEDRTEKCFFTYSMDKQSDSGVVGKPSMASKEEGDKYFELAVEVLTKKLFNAMNE